MDYSIIESYIDRLIAETKPEAPVWNIENIRHCKSARCSEKGMEEDVKLTRIQQGSGLVQWTAELVLGTGE